MGKKKLVALLCMSDCSLALHHGATGLSAVCDCGIFESYSLVLTSRPNSFETLIVYGL